MPYGQLCHMDSYVIWRLKTMTAVEVKVKNSPGLWPMACQITQPVLCFSILYIFDRGRPWEPQDPISAASAICQLAVCDLQMLIPYNLACNTVLEPILDRFWDDSGTILGRFWVDLRSIFWLSFRRVLSSFCAYAPLPSTPCCCMQGAGGRGRSP